MSLVVFALVLIVFGVIGWNFADDVIRLYRRYEDWVSDALEVQLGFLGWRVKQERNRTLVRALLGFGFVMGFLASGFSPIVGLNMAVALGALPVPLVQLAKARRWKAFDDQLLDGVNLLANGMKSGLGLPQAIQVLVREMDAPISDEFDRVLKEVQMGRTLDEALEAMNERMEHPELDLVITSIVTLRRTGGNMSETFDIISETIKERVLVEGKIRTLTSQGMMQMYMLISTPYALGAILYAMDPSFMGPMFTTSLGWAFLILVTALCFMGYVTIKRIVTIEV